MKFELTSCGITQAKKVLGDVQGKDVMINNTSLYGIVSIDIEEDVMYDSDPIPEKNYDGGKTDYIKLTFNFENGTVEHSFCPNKEHCEIILETEELWVIRIEDMKNYIERKKLDLDYRLEEYEKYMSK